MSAYYNENDPFAAQWLRELVKAGHIAPGDVDERSIIDVSADDVRGYQQCHWFGGIGGWSLALRIAGWEDDRPCWTRSPPCQPFSLAGKGNGAEDDRHLWPVWFRLIRERHPAIVFSEQVERAVRHGWLDTVSADLESEGYAFGAAVLGAHSVGAPHIRQRLYWVADGDYAKRRTEKPAWHVGNRQAAQWDESNRHAWKCLHGADWKAFAASFCEDDYGLSERVGRLRGFGNSIVPQVAAEFITATGL